MPSYTQLTQEQRYQISAMLRTGEEKTTIAEEIGVHKSTVGREIRRNHGHRGYRPQQAHRLTLDRRRKAKKRIEPETWALIDSMLRQDWSPEQISCRLKAEQDILVSHEWIYQHILADKRAGGDLYRHLRCQKKRRKRYGHYDRRGKLPNRVSIDERPAVVNERQRLGDWEVDTIIGKGRQTAIVTLTERKSRLALLRKVERKTAEAVSEAIIVSLQPWKEKTHTLTSDNGKEFAQHQKIAEQLDADFFFAHPYAAWERGSNENMNGLLRQYFPKKRNLDTVSDDEIKFVEHRLNHRPRKSLAFKTPFEVFLQQSVALKT